MTTKANRDFVLREVVGEHILVPIGTQANQFNGLISLNESGAFLWQQLQQNRTVDELVAALQQEYEVDEATARADVAQFVQRMQQAHLLLA